MDPRNHVRATPSRRHFLTGLGLTALTSALPPKALALEQTGAVAADPFRELNPTGSDLGSLWSEVRKLAAANRYTDSFLSGRFSSFAAFQSAARDQLLKVLLYRPEPVDPRPEVLQCSQDGLFPLAGMTESVETIATVYEQAGAKDKFTGRFYDVPHRFTRQMQDDAFAWFDRELA